MNFIPIDFSLHVSKNRPNNKSPEIDHRTNGWKRRKETFEKKTDQLVNMLQKCWSNGIDAMFVVFDSWYAHDILISKIVKIGYGVLCRLKKGGVYYEYCGQSYTLKQLWHKKARHQLKWIPSWRVPAVAFEVGLPHCGTVQVVFVRWSKKGWHAFLSTDTDLEIVELLDLYAKRWTIEVYFRDCKQFLGLGQGQSESFDAVIALASIVMIRHLLLSYIMARHQLTGSVGPLFAELAYQKLQLSLLKPMWTQLKALLILSTQLNNKALAPEEIVQLLGIIDIIVGELIQQEPAKL